jgi:hypothetical protein
MSAHALDREMGLAGVGGPEDCPDRYIVTPAHDHECGSAFAARKVPSTSRSILNRH